MIKALIFDCFGVFYADPVATYVDNPKSPKNMSDALQRLDEEAARDEVTKDEFDTEAAILLDEAPEAVEKQFFHSGKRNQQLIDFIQTLRKDYKVAVLSNIGSDMMDGFFTQAERKELFDDFILSGDVGLAKPDLAIFQLACDRLGVHPNEVVMIDDHQSNVDAAKRIGMQGIQYKALNQLQAQLNIILANQPTKVVKETVDSVTDHRPISRKTFHLQPWTPKVVDVANKLIVEINKATPELEVLFMGAAALRLPGKNDIDLDILCPAKKISDYTSTLSPVLGVPKKFSDTWAEWSFIKDGFEIDCILSDPLTSHVPEQKRTFDLLKANPRLLDEYRQLKIACDGLPYDEYERRKKEFFGTVLSKAIS